MDDLHSAPGEKDRQRLRERIQQAVAAGRISAADGDIRLTNVSSAQSLTELSLLARDLDQLDASVAAAERAAVPVAAPAPVAAPYGAPVASASSGRLVPLMILGVVVALVVAGAVALFVFSAGSDKDEIGDDPGASQVAETPGIPKPPTIPGNDPEPGDDTPPVVAFERTTDGIRSMLASYKEKFGTTRTTDLTMYDNYVIARVPVPGKARDEGFMFRDGVWESWGGGIRATSPGTEVLDLRRLDIAALLKNMAKAKRTLNVEGATISHVSMDFRSVFDDVPNVRIYASNTFGESGYLATTLQGSVVRSYPYSR